MFDAKIFGEKLRAHRIRLGLSQETLAEKIGVSGQAVSKWEKGECLPDCYNVKQLGEQLGVSLDILLETDGIGDTEAIAAKIEQLATEHVWRKMEGQQGENAHKELGDDLWAMWKAIYFVEVGDKTRQQEDKHRGNTRISGPYGAKVWDDAGVACVVQARLWGKFPAALPAAAFAAQLLSPAYFSLLCCLDANRPAPIGELQEKTGRKTAELYGQIEFLMQNELAEFHKTAEGGGYKLTGKYGIGAAMLLASCWLLSEVSLAGGSVSETVRY